MSDARTPVNVVVAFGPASPETEGVASAAAVGAVQARGAIRLRRCGALGDGPPEAIERIYREYALPTAEDFGWADALIIVNGGDTAWPLLLERIPDVGPGVGVILSTGSAPAGLVAALSDRGVTLLSIPEDARSRRHRALLAGRWIVMSVREPGAATPFDAAAELLGPEHDLH